MYIFEPNRYKSVPFEKGTTPVTAFVPLFLTVYQLFLLDSIHILNGEQMKILVEISCFSDFSPEKRPLKYLMSPQSWDKELQEEG